MSRTAKAREKFYKLEREHAKTGVTFYECSGCEICDEIKKLKKILAFENKAAPKKVKKPKIKGERYKGDDSEEDHAKALEILSENVLIPFKSLAIASGLTQKAAKKLKTETCKNGYKPVYKLYKFDEFQYMGSIDHIAKLSGYKESTIERMAQYQRKEEVDRGGRTNGIWFQKSYRLDDINEVYGEKVKEYALYEGEEIIAIGAIKGIADELGVKESTIRHYSTPTYRKRTSEEHGKRLVRLDEEVAE